MEQIKQAIKKAKAERDGAPAGRKPQPLSDAGAQSPASPMPPNCTLNPAYLETTRIVAFNGEDPKTAAYDMLRTRIMQKMRFSGWHVLGITSPRAGCGKTVTSINLAFSHARQPDQTVILADMDFRKPNVARYLGIDARHDVHAVLNNDAELASAFCRPDVGGPGLRILANAAPVMDPSIIVHSQRMRKLMKSMKDAAGSGIVIVDLPPVLAADDVIALLPQLDCLLRVVAAGETTPAEIEECDRLLSAANSVDIVLNKSDEADHSYYY